MNYNLKNKTLIMAIAGLATIIAMSKYSFAEDIVSQQNAQVTTEQQSVQQGDDFLNLENLSDANMDADKGDNDLLTPPTDEVNVNDNQNEVSLEFLDEEQSVPTDDANVNAENPETFAENEDVFPETDAPKSPFERFGNAILSKVDNNLFNQMAKIEKQTTLLQLELKREELKNKVAALRAARIRAQQEEEAKQREIEEQLKDREAQRQAMILEQQQKLKEKEMELEKIRQARVLNEYMNEMLVMNQKWIEENSKLQNRIKELEEERIALLADFKTKIGTVQQQSDNVLNKSKSSLEKHRSLVASLNSQIESMKNALKEAEQKLNNRCGVECGSGYSSDDSKPGKDAIDMSSKYAIMDITGKGDDIIAKIVSVDGTTFIVRKGSMLKGGEVVKSITNHYISFDNNGVESFLYTGGSIMDFEPQDSFNGAEKMPLETEKKSIREEVENVRGLVDDQGVPMQNPNIDMNKKNKSKLARSTRKLKSTSSSTNDSTINNAVPSASFGQGMFVH